MSDDTPIIVVTGNPVDGFTFYGPTQANSDEVGFLTDIVLDGQDWWYAPLIPLQEADQ